MLTKTDAYLRSVQQLQKKVFRRGINYSLDRFITALAALGNPHHVCTKAIHIAGTNGKGSVAHYITNSLQYMGHTVMTYTSPHIYDYTERFSRNSAPISRGVFSELLDEVTAVDPDDCLSEFECLTAMAFQFAKRYPVDYAVIETGLGGRLDATNVLPHAVAIITDIDMDHTDILGDTLAKIAYEKAGIIKPGATVITHADQPTEVMAVLQSVARDRQATIHQAVWEKGDFHSRNQALVSTALRVMFPEREPVWEDVLANVISLFGRFTPMEYRGVPCWVDVGHNVSAAKAMLGMGLPISEWVVGMQRHKNYEAVFQFLVDNNQSVRLFEFNPGVAAPYMALPEHLRERVGEWRVATDTVVRNTLFFGSFHMMKALQKGFLLDA